MNRKFFVVGAPKAGSTSIYNYLKQHPSIYLPNLKELHYFAYPEVKNTYYKPKFIDSLDDYKTYFNGAKIHQIIGDISPSYLYNNKTAKRIYEYDQDSKIIIILRNPIERAISHYLMDVKNGYQKDSLEKILTNKHKYSLFYKEYVKVGLYHEQIKNYLDVFPNEQVQIMLFDDLNNNKQLFVKNICAFLNIDEEFNFDLTNKHGAYAVPRNPVFNQIKNNKFINLALGCTSVKTRSKLKKIFYTEKIEKPDFSIEKEILENIFKEEKENLKKIEGLNSFNWLSEYDKEI